MAKAKPGKRNGSRLPAYVRELFWEYDKSKIGWCTDRELIIDRVLASGGWDSIVWLRKRMSHEELRGWFLRTRGRALDPPRLRFWELKLGLPHRSVNEWIKIMEQNPWHRRLL
jgi:hypothetical protein